MILPRYQLDRTGEGNTRVLEGAPQSQLHLNFIL